MANSYDISVIVPCLNEENTLGDVLVKIFATLQKMDLSYEVIVADNGSTDISVEIAKGFDVRVVHVKDRGYGNTLRQAFFEANGAFVFYGDADLSYDFGYLPTFWEIQQKGDYDLVSGSRLKGTMEPGAMPWLHRYIGTPALTTLINLMHGAHFSDSNSGMRLIRKSSLEDMNLLSEGMELSSEIYIRAKQCNLKVVEIPMDFYKDHRGRPPHLKTFQDGMRNLRCILRLSKK